jgi:hypothetical protein
MAILCESFHQDGVYCYATIDNLVGVREFHTLNMPHTKKASSFEDWAGPEVAANYRRLCRDKRVIDVIETLRRRGLTDGDIEILFRAIASIPRDWLSDREPWKQALQRRNHLAKKLRHLAKEIAGDPDLGGWCFQIASEHLNAPPEHQEGLRTFTSLLEQAARSLEPYNKPLQQISSGKILPFSAEEFEQRARPARRVLFKSYTLLAIFELLKSYGTPQAKKRSEPRALNRETEILASVLLQEQIKPGSVTQLRKKDRRRYGRDK